MEPTAQEVSHSPVFEKEITLSSGEIVKLPSLHIDKKILFHGSHASNLSQIGKAGDSTVGEGVYLTSDENSAKGYAERRARSLKTETPMLYSAEIQDINLVDLRKLSAIQDFGKFLSERLPGEFAGVGDYYVKRAIKDVQEKVSSGDIKGLKDLTDHFTQVTTDILRQLGYDGLITFEGGEGNDIGNHDTYLIFDPEKVKILATNPVEKGAA